jgi:hypothetical protein
MVSRRHNSRQLQPHMFPPRHTPNLPASASKVPCHLPASNLKVDPSFSPNLEPSARPRRRQSACPRPNRQITSPRPVAEPWGLAAHGSQQPPTIPPPSKNTTINSVSGFRHSVASGSQLTSQAEQEYDAQADMVDDDHDGSTNASYVPGFTPQSMASGSHNMSGFNQPSAEGTPSDFGNSNPLLGQYEPMLDTDPFGLSASMHFPTPFNYEHSGSRQ